MPKTLPVIWSPISEVSYSKILLYIKDKWSLNSAIEFDDRAEDLINTIGTHHKLCPQSKQAGYRKCKITPQTSMLYKVYKTLISIVNFVNNATSHSY